MDAVEDLDDIDDEESEEMDDEGEHDMDDQEEEDATPKKSTGRKARSILTGRGVTLAMLLNDKILEVGEKCLSIDYLGQKFQADLLPDGKIRWPEANKVFNSPSAWAIYCKRLVNPSKNSGCGWASVKYRGKKLDQFKTTWFRKQRPDALPAVKPTTVPTTSGFTKVRKKKKTEPVMETPEASISTAHSVATPVSHGTSKLNMMETPKTSHTPVPSLSPSTGAPPKVLSPPQTSPKPVPSHTSVIVHRPPVSLPPTAGSTHKIKKHKTPSPKLSTAGLPGPPPLLSPMSGKSPVPSHLSTGKGTKHRTSVSRKGGTGDPSVPLMSPPPPVSRKRAVRSRQSVKYSNITSHSDPQTLVELVNFTSTGRMQPFSVDIAGNCLLLMDYHCHLTTSEVVGYLAGKWDPQTHHMKILQAFPCRCRFADKENAPRVEEEIRNAIAQRGLMVLGWYHSHPTYQPDPSVQDIRNQQHHQKQIRMQLENTTLEPCLGIILAPYDSYRPTKESTFRAFWVQSPSDAASDHVGMPLQMNFTTQQDQFLSQDLLNELRWLWSFYKGSPDTINFQNLWHNNQTYLDKVKSSLIKKFPTDQTDGRFLEFINTLLS